MPPRTGAREWRVSQKLVNENALQASDKPYAGALLRGVATNRDAVHLHRGDGPRIRIWGAGWRVGAAQTVSRNSSKCLRQLMTRCRRHDTRSSSAPWNLLTRRGVLVEKEGKTYMADNDGDSEKARSRRLLPACSRPSGDIRCPDLAALKRPVELAHRHLFEAPRRALYGAPVCRAVQRYPMCRRGGAAYSWAHHHF